MWKAEWVGAWGGRRRAPRRWGTGPRRSGGSGTGGRALFEYAHSGGATQGRDTKAEGKEDGLVGPPPHPARPADTHRGHWERGWRLLAGYQVRAGKDPRSPPLLVGPHREGPGRGADGGYGRPAGSASSAGRAGPRRGTRANNQPLTHTLELARDWTEREPGTTRPITPAKSPNRRCGPRAVKSAPLAQRSSDLQGRGDSGGLYIRGGASHLVFHTKKKQWQKIVGSWDRGIIYGSHTNRGGTRGVVDVLVPI